MKIDSFFVSLTGDRTINEDFYSEFIDGDKAVFVLADGLGGHDNGEVASKLVCESICSGLSSYNGDANYLCYSVETAQESLLEEQKRKDAEDSLKTTLVALLIDKGTYSFAHSGDSRLYHIHKSTISSRTLDHSVPQMMALSGEIKEKEIRHHEDRGRLLKSMGNEWDEDSPQYELDEEGKPLDRKDAFLLCSDGFWEWITEKEINKILKKKYTAKQSLEEMIKIVEENAVGRNMDNCTAAYIRIEEI